MLRASCLGLVFGLISASSFSQSATTQPGASPVTPSAASATVPPAPALADPLGEARVLYRKGNFEAAIAKYQEFLRDRPQAPEGYSGIVRVYLKQKRVDEAAQTAELGLAHSDSPRMRVARAEVWFRQGKIMEAEKEWVNVVNSGYPEARAYLGLARVRHAVAMYKTEKTMIEMAHRLDPDDPDIQQEWVGTLSLTERVKYLEAAIAGENNWSTDERQDTISYLQYLKERAKRTARPCRLMSKGTATETPLVPLLIDPQHMRGYGLAVSLNGHKSLLLFDTGASGILVKRSIAEHAGISKITETKLMGIGNKGRRDAYVGVADSIQVGDLEFQNCPIEVMESGSVAGEDGLIGADVFEAFLEDIDFPNRKLRLSELPKRPGEAQQKLGLKDEDQDEDADDETSDANPDSNPPDGKPDGVRARDLPLQARKTVTSLPRCCPMTVSCVSGMTCWSPPASAKRLIKLFLLDTGALTNFISPAAAREVTKVHGDSDTIVKGISGKVDKVFSADKAVLVFGHLRQENQDITSFDTKPISDGIGTEVSGFLGFTTLRLLDIKIDYRDALIDFQYNAKRLNR